MSLPARRRAADHLQGLYGLSERRACRVMQLHRSTQCRRPARARRHAALQQVLQTLSTQYPRLGYRKIHHKLQVLGWKVSRERVRRLRQPAHWPVCPSVAKRRSTAKPGNRLASAQGPHELWSYDFVSDRTAAGRRVKWLTVIDEYTRQGLLIHGARALTAADVTQALAQLLARYGRPHYLKSDNGPEMVAPRMRQWLQTPGVHPGYIRPDRPWENGCNERFNGRFRDGCLNRWQFASLDQAQREADRWLWEYNHERPDEAFGGLTPAAFAQRCQDQPGQRA